MEDVEKLMKTSLAEIERLLNSKTVIGDPITVEGNTLIPLVSIGFGFGAGGGTGPTMEGDKNLGVGAGTGGGGGIKPVAVIVVNKDGVRIEALKSGTATLLSTIAETVAKTAKKRSSNKQSTE